MCHVNFNFACFSSLHVQERTIYRFQLRHTGEGMFRAMSLCWGKILWSLYEGTLRVDEGW